MKISDFVKGTIKVGGIIAKVGVEIGADAIGAIAEKIDDKPEEKERIVTSGKELGQKIKQKTSEIADDSVDVVDDIVETGKEAFDDISQTIRRKTGNYKKSSSSNESSTAKEAYKSNENENSEDVNSEYNDCVNREDSVQYKEERNGRTYIKLTTPVESEEE